MAIAKPGSQGLLRSLRLTSAVGWCLVVAGVLGSAPLAGADDYAQRIRPLLKKYCLGCHSTDAKKGGLDMERFATLEQVRADVEPWQAMVGMLENDEMPPKGKPRPTAEERRGLIAWIHDFLEREAQLRAGDPGPVLVRRLNNAEYSFTIRDLTGQDLRPARHFPADGAAGEGFLNATDALTISPDLLSKYLEAAKEIAAHAVLLPDGFRFSASTFREDWVNEILSEIVELYAKYTNEIGEVPLDRYLNATLVHRDGLLSGGTSIAEIAHAEKLSPKYLQLLWQVLTTDHRSMLLDGIRAKWREAAPEDLPGVLTEIRRLQGLLWHKQEPVSDAALDDRYVPATVTFTDKHTYNLGIPKTDDDVVFYLAAQTVAGGEGQTRIILERPRFESEKKPAVGLRDAFQRALKATPKTEPGKEPPAPPEGSSRLDESRFGRHPDNKQFEATSLLLSGSEVLEVRLPGALVSERTFVVEARLDSGSSPETLVRLYVQKTPALPQFERGLMWQYREASSGRSLLMVGDDPVFRSQLSRSAEQFRRIFLARVCYPGVIVRDAVVTLERFHRGDASLSRLLLSEEERQRLDRLWEELHYVSGDALQVWNSLATLTQGEMKIYEKVKEEVERRAKHTEDSWLASEPFHLESILDFAARAFRRPLTEPEQQSLRDHYQLLRKNELPHDEAVRAVLARVFVSPKFLYRIEQSAEGKEPEPISDWELATRLSYFLWSSLPDEELSQAAGAGRLHDSRVLAYQIRRMLQDSRIRALAIEFGAQWLEVRGFDQFQGKNLELFPTFNAELRGAMYEETILFFEDMIESDRPIWQLIDADHAFLNETLAKHYGIPDVRGDEFRRVDGVQKDGRGGILGLASVLAKHSGASRTSPVLRGNWIAEFLLGEKLPRPPDGVPELPDGESVGDLTIRQLVEKHAELEQCAVCHQRVDPLGFALEQYDTIGRWRDKDLGGRPVDAKARLQNGTEFEGINGLRQYMLKERRADFVRQFCRKLLGYALGRRVILSDRQLLKEMAVALEENDGRLSAVIFAVVNSKQFRLIRGSAAAKRRQF